MFLLFVSGLQEIEGRWVWGRDKFIKRLDSVVGHFMISDIWAYQKAWPALYSKNSKPPLGYMLSTCHIYTKLVSDEQANNL